MLRTHRKHRLAAVCTGLLTAIALAAPASAATQAEFVKAARDRGIPELAIQEALNKAAERGLDTPEGYDEAIRTLDIYKDKTLEEIASIFGVTYDPNKYTTTVPVAQGGNTTAATTTVTTTQAGINNNPNSGGITSQEFIKMTLEQKAAYVKTLPESEQLNFLLTLNAEEMVSIIKQMSLDSKANVVGSLVEVGKQWGMDFTVNDMTDNNLTLGVRDESGKLVGETTLGTAVEETGITYRGLISVAVALIGAAGVGAVVLQRKLRREAEDA